MIEVVTEAAWRPGVWAHGTTHAIAAWTDGAGAVIARLSVATIAAAGAFSSFAGCDRWLAVLDDGGGLALGSRALAAGDALAFSGDDVTIATPTRPARVFNLIVRRGIAWHARVAGAARLDPGVVAIFAALAPLIVEAGDHRYALPRFATALVTAPAPLRIDGPAIVVAITLPADARR